MNSEDELLGGEGNLEFDDILGEMGVEDIISGSESEEERKGPRFIKASKGKDALNINLDEDEIGDEKKAVAKIQSELLKAFDKHVQKSKGVPDITRAVEANVRTEN